MNDLPEHVRRNRAVWDRWASEYAGPGEAAWAKDPPTWGIWGVPESELALLPDDLAGKDAIELGCGTAYVSAWMARLLRSGGRLVFLVNSFLMALCAPDEDGVAATDQLRRPAFGLYRLEFPGEFGVEFHPSHGDWIRLLRRSEFEFEDLIEVRPPATAATRYPFVTLDWARQWPSEEVWKVRKRA